MDSVVIRKVILDMTSGVVEERVCEPYNGAWSLCGKGGGGPAPPDPKTIADAQINVNKITGQDNAFLNRYDQTNPYGNLHWSTDKDGRWSATQTLNPALQGVLDTSITNLSKPVGPGYSNADVANLLNIGGWGRGNGQGPQTPQQPQGQTGGNLPPQQLPPNSSGGGTSPTQITPGGVDPRYWQGQPLNQPQPQTGGDLPPQGRASLYGNGVTPAGGSAGGPDRPQTGGPLPPQYAGGGQNPSLQSLQGLGAPEFTRALQSDIPIGATAARGAAPMMVDAGDGVQVGQWSPNMSPIDFQRAQAGQAQAQQVGDRSQNLAAMGYGTSMAGMPTTDLDTRGRLEQAMYDKATSRLDPQFQQRESDLQSRLANQGITQGSEAYEREAANLGRERNDAYEGARNTSVAQGAAELNAQYQRELALRQQTGQEALSAQGLGQAGDVTNAQLGTQTSLANASNTTGVSIANMQAESENQRLLRQLENQAGMQTQQLGVQAGLGNQDNALRAGMANQSTALQDALQNRQIDATLASQNRGQDFSLGQNLRQQDMSYAQGNYQTQANYLSQLQQMQTQRDITGMQGGTARDVAGIQGQTSRDVATTGANAQMSSSANSASAAVQAAQLGADAQRFGYQTSANTAANQQELSARLAAPGTALQLAQLNNYGRNQNLAELQAINGLRVPGNMGGDPGTGSAPNMGQIYGNNYNAASNNYNQGVSSNNNLIGAGLSAAATYWSDVLLKHDIVQVGNDPRGFGLYEFSYNFAPGRFLGVIAQEVEPIIPAAVITMPNGYKAVNYSLLS